MPKSKLSTVTSLIRNPLAAKPDLSDGVRRIEGPTLDRIEIHGIMGNATTRVIAGRPMSSDLDAEEVRQFLATNVLAELKEAGRGLLEKDEKLLHTELIQRLKQEKATMRARLTTQIDTEIQELEEEAAKVDARQIDQLHQEAKHIETLAQELRDSLARPVDLMAETYVFDDYMVLQINHTEFPLVDYGKVDVDSGDVLVYGMLYELPQPIKVGMRNFKFALFDPWDTRPIEDGGVIKVMHLNHEDRMALYTWVERAMKWNSVFSTWQKYITTMRENKVLNETIKGLRDKVGGYAAELEKAREELIGHGMLTNISAIIVQILISGLGFGAIGLSVGLFIALMFGITTTTAIQPVYNETSGALIRNDHLVSQTMNPIVIALPALFTFGGWAFSLWFSSRRWGRRTSR